jgi:hypothetical protein
MALGEMDWPLGACLGGWTCAPGEMHGRRSAGPTGMHGRRAPTLMHGCRTDMHASPRMDGLAAADVWGVEERIGDGSTPGETTNPN